MRGQARPRRTLASLASAFGGPDAGDGWPVPAGEATAATGARVETAPAALLAQADGPVMVTPGAPRASWVLVMMAAAVVWFLLGARHDFDV